MKTIQNALKTNRHSNPSQKLYATAILLTVSLGIMTTGVQAAPIVIQDTYIGGTATNHNYDGLDIIGDAALFDVSRMEVSFLPANTMTIDIYSRYFDNIGDYGTQLGDLFLSTNGYQGEGEQWEYALKLDNYLPDIATTTSGSTALYSVQTANIITSSAPGNYIYRSGQEVQYNPTGQSALATGSWSLNNIGGSDTDDFLRFTFAYDFGDVSTYGLHWGMTCGNDVIEGAAPVPEPSAMLLFGTGLMGLGGILRRKMQSNNDIRMK